MKEEGEGPQGTYFVIFSFSFQSKILKEEANGPGKQKTVFLFTCLPVRYTPYYLRADGNIKFFKTCYGFME